MGQFHSIDNILTHRQAQFLAVHCPACPEVGFNVAKEKIDTAKENETYVMHHSYISSFDDVNCSHKYTLFLLVDGNFHLQRKNKNSDPDDVALNNSHAYFVKSNDFMNYLGVVQPSDDVCNHSHFKLYNLLTTSTERHLFSFASGTYAEYCQVQEHSYQRRSSCSMCTPWFLPASRHG